MNDRYLNYLMYEKRYSKHTIDSYQRTILQLDNYLETQAITIESLTYKDVRGYLIYLGNQGCSSRTIAHHVSVLRQYFKYLVKQDIVLNNPWLQVDQLKIKAKMPEFLYYDDIETLFDAIDVTTPLGIRNLAIMELMYGCGLRVSEVTRLDIKSLNLSQAVLLVHGKGDKDRYVPVHEVAIEAVQDYLSKSRSTLATLDEQALFVNHLGKRITTRGIQQMVKKLGQTSGVHHNLHPHMLRHSFATHLLEGNADLRSVQELLGHDHIVSTQVYTHMTKERLKDIYQHHHPRNKKEDIN